MVKTATATTTATATDNQQRHLDTPTRYTSKASGQSEQVPLSAVLGVHVYERTVAEGGDTVEKVFLVHYMGHDDETDAQSWSHGRRMMATVIISAIGGIVGFASAIDSAALPQSMKEFGVGELVGSLATCMYILILIPPVLTSSIILTGVAAMFLIGFGFGAVFAGPVSEFTGRNPVYIVTMAAYMIWIMATGLAPNITSQAIFRLLAGFFGATPLVCAGGSLADMWSPRERVYAFPIFAISSFMGPALGPVVGGYTGESPLVSWRWVSWITLILSGLILAAVVFLLPESYSPVMLKWKAHHLRTLTGDPRYISKIELDNSTFGRMITRSLGRPFVLTVTEPIILLVAIYLTVIYVIMFTFLNGYTFIFTETYGFTEGLTGLCFLGIAVGITLAGAAVPFVYRSFCAALQRAEEVGLSSTAPETHLTFALIAAPAIPVSLFWMGWTARPSISPWSPLVASVLFGYGIIGIFISSYQYVIASYDIYAASALASVTFIRYVVAGAMVEAAIPFYTNAGVAWTLTVLGIISALLAPVPYVFYRQGHLLRKKSRFAFV